MTNIPKPLDRPAAAQVPSRVPLRLGRTLRFGIRAAWDSIGFVCASSLTLFAAFTVPASLAAAVPHARGSGVWASAALAVLIYLLTVPPLYAGICSLALKVLEHDEPSYIDIWRGFRLLYWHSVALGTVHVLAAAILLANMLFYLSRPSLPFLFLAIVFGYALLFWLMNVFYHWPLLIAAEAGLIKRETGEKPRLGSVFRNGFLLTVSAPAFTLLLAALLCSIAVPLIVSGVGMALLLPGFAAFLTTQATRDQLVRFGVAPPQFDPDEPINDERWRV